MAFNREVCRLDKQLGLFSLFWLLHSNTTRLMSILIQMFQQPLGQISHIWQDLLVVEKMGQKEAIWRTGQISNRNFEI